MNVKTILGCITVVCIFSATNVFAVESKGGYVSGTLGRSFLSDASYTGTTTSGEVEYDDGFAFIGGGGYDWGMWRIEGELSFAINDVDSYTDGAVVRDGGDRGIDIWSLMVNGVFEIENKSKFTPFFLLGLGYSYIDGFNVDTVAETIASDSDTVWGWQLGFGCDYYYNDTLSFGLSYRYMATDDVSLVGGQIENEGHRGLLGVKKLF